MTYDHDSVGEVFRPYDLKMLEILQEQTSGCW